MNDRVEIKVTRNGVLEHHYFVIMPSAQFSKENFDFMLDNYTKMIKDSV